MDPAKRRRTTRVTTLRRSQIYGMRKRDPSVSGNKGTLQEDAAAARARSEGGGGGDDDFEQLDGSCYDEAGSLDPAKVLELCAMSRKTMFRGRRKQTRLATPIPLEDSGSNLPIIKEEVLASRKASQIVTGRNLEPAKEKQPDPWSREGLVALYEAGLNVGKGLSQPPHVIPYRFLGTPDLKRDDSLLPKTFQFAKRIRFPNQDDTKDNTKRISSEPMVLPLTLRAACWNGERWEGMSQTASEAKRSNGFNMLYSEVVKSQKRVISCKTGRYFLEGIFASEPEIEEDQDMYSELCDSLPTSLTDRRERDRSMDSASSTRRTGGTESRAKPDLDAMGRGACKPQLQERNGSKCDSFLRPSGSTSREVKGDGGNEAKSSCAPLSCARALQEGKATSAEGAKGEGAPVKRRASWVSEIPNRQHKHSPSVAKPFIPPLPLKKLSQFDQARELAHNHEILSTYREESNRYATARLRLPPERTEDENQVLNSGRTVSGLPLKACGEISLRQLGHILSTNTSFATMQNRFNRKLMQSLQSIQTSRPYHFAREFGMPSTVRHWDSSGGTPRRAATCRKHMAKFRWYENLVEVTYYTQGRHPNKSQVFIIEDIRRILDGGEAYTAKNLADLFINMRKKNLDLEDACVQRALLHVQNALKVTDLELLTDLMLHKTKLPSWLESKTSIVKQAIRDLSPNRFPMINWVDERTQKRAPVKNLRKLFWMKDKFASLRQSRASVIATEDGSYASPSSA